VLLGSELDCDQVFGLIQLICLLVKPRENVPKVTLLMVRLLLEEMHQ